MNVPSALTRSLLRIASAVAVTLACSVALYGRLDGAAPQGVSRPVAVPGPDRGLLQQYCLPCHSDRVRQAGLALETMDPAQPGAAPAVWEKVVRKLRAGQMPPGGSRRPAADAVHTFVSRLEALLDALAASRPQPGRPATRRLNRTEYANVVKDLLALDVDVRDLLPADDAEHGFDNMAEALTVSSTLTERYLAAARRVSDLAIGPDTVPPAGRLHTVSEGLLQDEQVSDDLPFGSRGGATVHHHFATDGEYLFRVRLRRTLYGYIRGIGRSHRLDLRIDGRRAGSLKFGGEERGAPSPASYSGDAIANETWEDYMHRADEHLEFRLPVKAGTRAVSVVFPKSLALGEGRLEAPLDKSTFNYAVDEMLIGNPGLGSLEILGPYAASGPGDTASRRRIFICRPAGGSDAQRACASTIMAALARRAFRRPVSGRDVEELMQFYDRTYGTAAGNRFDAGVTAALTRLLIDPEFLFRLEHDPAGSEPGEAYRLTDLELASRLSFFLWSSVPDEALLDAAVGGRLRQPAVLDRQVRRMIADPRSRRSLVENFASQWLELRNLASVAPDPAVFPAFSENLRNAMRAETEMFLEDQIVSDASVLDLIRANYTFLNEDLARHYDIPGVSGPHFRRVTVPDGTRGGLFGQASLLTVTSYANRTSPVVRGAWVLDKILDAPPPPPPGDVPGFPEAVPGPRPLSVRERLEQHRRNPACATCHTHIDPLGFALEPYDAIGRWRTTNETLLWYEEGAPIDASGRLVDGTAIDGPAGLKKVVLSRPAEFAASVTTKLLTYALGRGLEPSDMPAVRRIVRDAAKTGYRWSSLVTGVVNSVPFQMRSVAP